MIDFRCYKCWQSSGYRGSKDHITCSRCGAKLYVGMLDDKVIYGNIIVPSEHNILSQKLHESISRNKKIYRGAAQIIAGEEIRHRPSAIYYRCGKMFENQPIIYEIETCDSIGTKNAISRCKLFSETAYNLLSKFHLVVPRECNVQSGKKIAEKILEENNIEYFEIITI